MTDTPQPPKPGILLGNLADPIRLHDLGLSGFAAGAARGGETIKVWTRLYLTSDDPVFHEMAKGFADHVTLRAQVAGSFVNLRSAACVLLVIHPDKSADLWVDTAAIAHQILLKRDTIQPGMAVFEQDVADIVGMSFPGVEIGQKDRVVCLFREGWRFGLFFDLSPDHDFSVTDMQRDLGTLVRWMRYAELYSAIRDDAEFTRLIEAGWFPFAEIIGEEFKRLLRHMRSGFDLDEIDKELVAAFDAKRLDRMMSRWLAQPHFAGKRQLLESAVRAFQNGDPVAVLKTALTEIEGILNEAYFQQNGKRTSKIGKLLQFAIAAAKKRAGGPDTLLFPEAFGRYLRDYVFKSFDPGAATGKAGSRHAVGHGAADAESYTMTRALQSLLTLDQLCFYTAQSRTQDAPAPQAGLSSTELAP